MRLLTILGILVGGLAACSGGNETKSNETAVFTPASCEIGVYGPVETFVAITRRDNTFRYSYSDGRWGEISDSGTLECGDGAVRIAGSKI